MSGEASTPPHHPAFQVHISPQHINHIVSTLYPGHVVSFTEGPRDISYNNRIYFLDITNSTAISTAEAPKVLKAVLKVSGHFFNHTKIQNEVSALLLLARHCPSTPAPLVLAWSEDGRSISTYAKTVSDTALEEADRNYGWVLMTHLPGQTLTTADLDSPSGPSLIRQISQFNASWRTAIPSVPMFGNIRRRSPSEALLSFMRPWETSSLNESYTIGGFFLCHHYDPAPIKSVQEYYTYMLKDQIHRVMISKSYDDVRCDLVPLIADFVEQDLPHLSYLQEQQHQQQQHQDNGTVAAKGVFTHMDLAPRNILVQKDPDTGEMKVSGMVDFEFAAFLPESNEFINAYVRQEGDWTEEHYRMLMQGMADEGCRVPPIDGVKAEKSWTKREWKEACLLWKLIDNIAPWYIMDGKMGIEELRLELEKAGRLVRECIKELQKLRLEEEGEQRLAS